LYEPAIPFTPIAQVGRKRTLWYFPAILIAPGALEEQERTNNIMNARWRKPSNQ